MFKSKKYIEFLKKLREIEELGEIMGLLSWDQETMMPSGALECRAHQKSTLSGIIHDKATSPQLGDLAREIEEEYKKSSDEDPHCKANLREFWRDYNRSTKVPKKLVQEISHAETTAHAAWAKARKEDKFGDFAPHMEKLLKLRQEESQAIDDTQSPYDVQLDKFEVGVKSEEIKVLFEDLKTGLIPLLQTIKQHPQKINSQCLQGVFPIDKQNKFAIEIAQALGFDFDRGRMDISVHPFCGGAGKNDIRMTTRYKETNFFESIFAVIHETGHALYEQGLSSTFQYQPIGHPRSMGVHESQSLLWEKHVGLSREFWQYYYPKAQKHFNPALDSVSFEEFFRAINAVKPSLIRVDADEVTYPLHVILRFELEQMFFHNEIKITDLPEIWNKKMKEYLGVTPPNNREGVLQDVHWAYGLFGYFPTYNLGAIYASQIFEKVKEKIAGLEQRFAQGNFKPLKDWLNREVHERGSWLETNDLMQTITGETLNAQIHLNYLEQKYTEIYGL